MLMRRFVPALATDCLDRLRARPLAHRLARGAFWAFSGAVSSRFLSLLASIITARLLGKETFGELGIIQSTIGLFGTIGGFGLGITATKYVAEFRQSDPAKAGRVIALSNMVALGTGLVAAIGLALAAKWLASGMLAAPHLSGLLRVSALLLLFSALNGAQTGALAGFEAFKTIAFINIWAGLATFPLTIAGVLLGGLPGVVWALVASMFINWLLNYFALRREAHKASVPLGAADWSREARVLWTFSVPATLSGLLFAPVYWFCSTLLVNEPGGYGEMGIYNAANQWKSSILFIPGVLVQLVLPILANLHGENNFAKQKKVVIANMLLNGSVCLVAAGVLSLLATHIMRSYGPSFETGAMALRFLLFSAVISAMTGVVGQFIASSGKMWWGFVLNGFWAVCLVSCATALKSRGATGLAMADFFSYCAHLLTILAFAIWQFRKMTTGQTTQTSDELRAGSPAVELG